MYIRKAFCAFFTIITLLTLLPGCQENRVVKLYYTASLYGNLDGCTCQTRPKAGLVKRANFLNQVPDKGSSLLVDGGDVLLGTPDEDLDIQILDSYKDLGYAAIGVGVTEFSGGIEALLKFRDSYPLLNNNIIIKTGEPALFSKEPLVVRRGNYTIGIFALFDPAVLNDPVMLSENQITQDMKEMTILPVDQAARDCLANLKERKADLTVLLFFGTTDTLMALLAAVPGIDVVVLAFEQTMVVNGSVPKTMIVSPGEEGNRLGMLNVTFREMGIKTYGNSFKRFDYFKDPDDANVRARIDAYQKRMNEKLK